MPSEVHAYGCMYSVINIFEPSFYWRSSLLCRPMTGNCAFCVIAPHCQQTETTNWHTLSEQPPWSTAPVTYKPTHTLRSARIHMSIFTFTVRLAGSILKRWSQSSIGIRTVHRWNHHNKPVMWAIKTGPLRTSVFLFVEEAPIWARWFHIKTQERRLGVFSHGFPLSGEHNNYFFVTKLPSSFNQNFWETTRA